jgi:hypothetical protein
MLQLRILELKLGGGRHRQRHMHHAMVDKHPLCTLWHVYTYRCMIKID